MVRKFRRYLSYGRGTSFAQQQSADPPISVRFYHCQPEEACVCLSDAPGKCNSKAVLICFQLP